MTEKKILKKWVGTNAILFVTLVECWNVVLTNQKPGLILLRT